MAFALALLALLGISVMSIGDVFDAQPDETGTGDTDASGTDGTSTSVQSQAPPATGLIAAATGGGPFPSQSDTIFDYRANEGMPEAFNIEIDFVGEWTNGELRAAERASEFLSDLILDDSFEVGGADALPVDDLLVRIGIEPLPADTLGLETTRLNYEETGLPVLSDIIMRDGLELDVFQSTVLHEMLHSLGIGGDAFQGMVRNIDGVLRFTGVNAIAAYLQQFPNEAAQDAGAGQGVPVDDLAHHWSGSSNALAGTLMAPDLAVDQDLSLLTIAALEDIGYDTIWDDVLSATDRTGTLPQVRMA